MQKKRRYQKVVKGIDYVLLFWGVALTFFNLCVFGFADGNIYPRYFEPLFAIYWFIALCVGIRWIYLGLKNRKVYFEEVK